MGLGSFSGHRAGFWPKNLFLLWDPGFRQWAVFSPRRYLRFGTFGLIFSGRSGARRVIFRPPGRIFAQKSVFCYRTPDFINDPFLALDDIFDLAPLDRFLNFSFPSYGCFREGDPQNDHILGFPNRPFLRNLDSDWRRYRIRSFFW